jgi:hypothetical protein
MFFIERDPFLHDGLRIVTIIKARAAIACLDAGAKEVSEAGFVMRQMILERLNRRGRSASLILG